MKILFIILFIAHLYEEQYWPGGFQSWWNKKLWRSGEEEFPLSKKTNLNRNTIGLLTAGVALGVLGMFWPPALFVFVGFILCDALLHIGLSAEHGYFPGSITSVGYIIAAVYFLYSYQNRPELWAIYMVVGVMALLAVYLESFLKVHKKRTRG